MKYFVFILLLVSNISYAQEKKFECVASAILQMEFSGTFEDQKLTSELMVNIEGSLFFVENENIGNFSFHVDEKGNENFLLSSLEEESDYSIDIKSINNRGTVVTDYRGITLNNELICFISNLDE